MATSNTQKQKGGHKNALTIIKQDHRAVEKLYREYKAAKEKSDERHSLAERICSSLDLHAKMEEKHFYPALSKELTGKDELLVAEAYAEHVGMKALVKTAKTLPEGLVREATLKALMEVVKHHVKEEESEMLPKAEKELGEEKLIALGAKMATMSPSEKEKRTMERSTR